MALNQVISAECGMENCELSLVTSSHPCLSVLTVSLSTQKVFLWLWDMELFFSLLDGWLMFDGLRYMSFFDVTSNAWKLLSVEVNMEIKAKSDILQYSCAMEHAISS